MRHVQKTRNGSGHQTSSLAHRRRGILSVARSKLTMEARLIDGFLQVLRGHSIEIEMTPQLFEDLKFQLTAVLHDSPSLNR